MVLFLNNRSITSTLYDETTDIDSLVEVLGLRVRDSGLGNIED